MNACLHRLARGGKARTAGLLAGCLGLTVTLAAAAAPPSSGQNVTTVPGALHAVSAVSPGDAWAAGLVNGKPLILHWNGSTWRPATVSAPARGVLNAMSATSAGDAWAVGTGNQGLPTKTVALHWNGTTWTRVASPNPGSKPVGDDLFGMSALSPSDVWAVGEFGPHLGGANALVVRWNGKSWAQVPAPHPGILGSDLFAVSALSPADAWATGVSFVENLTAQTLALHWNGSKWTRIPSPNPGAGHTGELNAVVALSPANVWAVGDDGVFVQPDKTLILHWNGKNWAQVPSPSPGGSAQNSVSFLIGVSAVTANDIWAVGAYGRGNSQKTLVVHWNGTAWKQVPSPSVGTTSGLSSVAALSSASAWAVGGTGSRQQVLILHWNGTAWTRS